MVKRLPPNVIKIPIEYYSDFEDDAIVAWSSFGDTPQESEFPYFEDRAAIHLMVDPERLNPIDDELNFHPNFKCNDDFYRFIHIDLGHTGDSCGITMCHVSDWVKRSVKKKDEDGQYFTSTDFLPFFTVDFLCQIEPKGSEIIFSDVREIIYECYGRGFPILLITFDRFQSVDCIQILRRGSDTVPGFICANLSLDRTSNYPIVDLSKKPFMFRKESTGTGKLSGLAAWSHCKSVINSQRISVPFYKPISDTTLYSINTGKEINVSDWGTILPDKEQITLIESEAFSATFDAKATKVKEAPRTSIDLLESLAGAIFNANNNVTEREIEETKQQKRLRQAKEIANAETSIEREDIKKSILEEDDDDVSEDDIFDIDSDDFIY